MKPLKYKIWDKNWKDCSWLKDGWVDQYYWINDRGDIYDDGGYCEPTHLKDNYDHLEVSYSTGMFDKNGTEIYEGDILEVKHTSLDPNDANKYTVVVKFGQGVFGIDIDKKIIIYHNPTNTLRELFPNSILIIGNKYENPELLENIK